VLGKQKRVIVGAEIGGARLEEELAGQMGHALQLGQLALNVVFALGRDFLDELARQRLKACARVLLLPLQLVVGSDARYGLFVGLGVGVG